MKDFSEQLKLLPHSPGVYIMYDAEGTIIYVGKTISLYNRVRSYFQKGNSNKTPKVISMVEYVDRFEYVLVENEVEALVLESNFIKEYSPKYNIVLRDDKQYPYIRIKNESFPRIQKVRKIENDGSRYFGPYPNAYAVNEMIKLLQRIYSIRTCNMNFDKDERRARPCLYHFIGQCDAPCVGKASEEKYNDSISKVETFLKGKDKELRDYLNSEMIKASKEMQFEKAAGFRDDILHLDQLMEKQTVTFSGGNDADIIAAARGSNMITVQIFFFRNGKIVDREHFTVKQEFEEELSEVLSSFIKQFYLDATYIPKEILIEESVKDQEAIEKYLSEKRGSKVTVHVPMRGSKNDLMKKAIINAEEQLQIAERNEAKRERNIDRGIRELEKILNIKDINRVESYDVSNISGVQNVGSMVVYLREKKQPKEYRKFKIKTVDGIDEYASQREMLSRRFDHGIKSIKENKTDTGFGVFPDLILMDGGKGQVHLVEKILEERNLRIPVVGMIKDDKHKTKSLFYMEHEIPLDQRSALYKYLYAVQEEVHRFAINYHRKLREKDMVHSALDDIKGIGKIRRESLLKKFGSVEEIRKLDIDTLAKVEGMNIKAAEAVYSALNKMD